MSEKPKYVGEPCRALAEAIRAKRACPVVPVNSQEMKTVARLFKQAEIPWIRSRVGKEEAYWTELEPSVLNKIAERQEEGFRVFGVNINGKEPEGILTVEPMIVRKGRQRKRYAAIELIDLALDHEFTPFHRMLAADSLKKMAGMKEEAVRMMREPDAQRSYARLLKSMKITAEELERYRLMSFDPTEEGLGEVPLTYRPGISMSIRKIRKWDRKCQGITPEMEQQAERALLNAYTIGAVTVVEVYTASPDAIIDRLPESIHYGLLIMFAHYGMIRFYGPGTKVQKIAEAFPEGKTDGDLPVFGWWTGYYDRHPVLDFIREMEHVR